MAYRGRRSRPNAGQAFRAEALLGDRNIMDGLIDEPMQTIDIPHDDPSQEKVKIADCTYIGSYNWLDRDAPTILVPGLPPMWMDRELPYQVPADWGFHCCDQNGYRISKTILLPLIVAVNHRAGAIETPFDWASVDIVTDRNGLRKLIRWINGTASHDFRFDLQLAGDKTILMNRFPQKIWEHLRGFAFRNNFEKFSTMSPPGYPDCANHYRIVTYDMNGLKMVVRFEVDAYLHVEPPLATPPGSKPETDSNFHTSLSDVTRSFSAATLSEQPSIHGINIQEGGTEIQAQAVVELTTRSSRKARQPALKELYPQLFFSQTAYHFFALHDQGCFVELQERTLSSPDLQAVEKEAQVDMKKLRKALDLVKSLVIAHGKDGRLSLICRKGVLKVYRRDSDESCLPSSAMRLFELS